MEIGWWAHQGSTWDPLSQRLEMLKICPTSNKIIQKGLAFPSLENGRLLARRKLSHGRQIYL